MNILTTETEPACNPRRGFRVGVTANETRLFTRVTCPSVFRLLCETPAEGWLRFPSNLEGVRSQPYQRHSCISTCPLFRIFKHPPIDNSAALICITGLVNGHRISVIIERSAVKQASIDRNLQFNCNKNRNGERNSGAPWPRENRGVSLFLQLFISF